MIKPGSNSYQNWRKPLNLIPLFQHMILYKVGNGQKMFFWHDNWYPKGPLLLICSSRVIFDSGIPINAKVSKFIRNCSWICHPARSLEMLEIQHFFTSHIVPSTLPDTVIWTPSKSGHFHLGTTWNSLRTPYHTVQWFPLIQFKGMVLRHYTILLAGYP